MFSTCSLRKTRRFLLFLPIFCLAKPSTMHAAPSSAQPVVNEQSCTLYIGSTLSWQDLLQRSAFKVPRLGIVAGCCLPVGEEMWTGYALSFQYCSIKYASSTITKFRKGTLCEKVLYMPVTLHWGLSQEWDRALGLGCEFSYHWDTKFTPFQASVARKLSPSILINLFLEAAYELPMGISFCGKLKTSQKLFDFKTYRKAFQQRTIREKDEDLASLLRLVFSNVCELGLNWNFAEQILNAPHKAPERRPL